MFSFFFGFSTGRGTYCNLFLQSIKLKKNHYIQTDQHHNIINMSRDMGYQFRLSWRFTFSYRAFVSALLGLPSNSARYWSIAWSILPTGNSPRPTEDCGRRASSNQSPRRTAMSEEMAWTLGWSLNGGICVARIKTRKERKMSTKCTWDSYISWKTSHISTYGTPHWTNIRGAQPYGITPLWFNANLTINVAMCPATKLWCYNDP